MLLKSSKINEFRLWGLLLTLIGMGIMVCGTAGMIFWGEAGKIIAVLFLAIGMISLLLSMGVYFWAGMLSTSAVILACPECGRQTKLLGTTDRCMFCKTILTLDPSKASDAPSSARSSESASDDSPETKP